MNETQKFEADYWGNCINTSSEEDKQRQYAELMGLRLVRCGAGWGYDLHGRSVIDLGGGPVSLLLKCANLKKGRTVVVDPGNWPDWVRSRYECAGIEYAQMPAEELRGWSPFDEAWIYNVLQHTDDPAKIIANAKKYARILRIFEWVGFPAYPGHPQALTKEKLDEWIGQRGQTVQLTGQHECVGTAYYGVFDLTQGPTGPIG